MPETKKILDSFRKIVRALRLNSKETLIKNGLSGAQLFVLQKIGPKEALSVNEFAERTHTDQSSVSVVISKLVSKGMLTKAPSPVDRRKSLHSLTENGKKAIKQSQSLVQNHLLESVAELKPAERKQLSQLLDKVLAGAELTEEPATLFFEDERKTHVKPRKS